MSGPPGEAFTAVDDAGPDASASSVADLAFVPETGEVLFLALSGVVTCSAPRRFELGISRFSGLPMPSRGPRAPGPPAVVCGWLGIAFGRLQRRPVPLQRGPSARSGEVHPAGAGALHPGG